MECVSVESLDATCSPIYTAADTTPRDGMYPCWYGDLTYSGRGLWRSVVKRAFCVAIKAKCGRNIRSHTDRLIGRVQTPRTSLAALAVMVHLTLNSRSMAL